ncbi:MAG: hypothetical protein QMC98_01480 [Candidatus Thermoplasmatota archaeon]|nr:hypothetical protein [Candidatus Thermoplasmatota archaeon]
MKLIKPIALLLASLLISVTSSAGNESPWLDNFKVPTIIPGEQGELSFTLQNRYNSSLENVSLGIEIYRYGTLEGTKNITELNAPPMIKENNRLNITFYFYSINSTQEVKIRFTILTSDSTLQGTYFVRMKLGYRHNNSSHELWSRGYFSAQAWQVFESTGNLPAGCDSVIPESSFRVRALSSWQPPFPFWLLYLLSGLGIALAILACFFYFKEERRKGL